MDLKFTDEQDMLRETTQALCRDASGMDVVRQMENDPIGIPEKLWTGMREAGLTGIFVPEEYGGTGLDLLSCVVIYEELGRALAPGPHFGSAVMSVLAVREAGSAAQKSALLPRLASGDTVIVPAWLEPDRGYGPEGVQLEARRSGEGYRLTGVKRHVFHAKAASRLLVLARTGKGEDEIDLFLVDADASGLVFEQQKSMASDTQYRVTFEDVAAERLGAAGSGWQTWTAVMSRGIVLLAAFAAGGAARALEITVQYSKDRQQFGKPIGAFQALAHYLADASPVVEGAKMLAHEAAWAHDQGKDTRRLAPMAKLFCCQAFRDITHMAQQVHGGIGFTLDYHIQLYYRRAKQLQLNWWDSRHLEELIAADVLDRQDVRAIADPFAA